MHVVQPVIVRQNLANMRLAAGNRSRIARLAPQPGETQFALRRSQFLLPQAELSEWSCQVNLISWRSH